jgi:hypothetical protein
MRLGPAVAIGGESIARADLGDRVHGGHRCRVGIRDDVPERR